MAHSHNRLHTASFKPSPLPWLIHILAYRLAHSPPSPSRRSSQTLASTLRQPLARRCHDRRVTTTSRPGLPRGLLTTGTAETHDSSLAWQPLPHLYHPPTTLLCRAPPPWTIHRLSFPSPPPRGSLLLTKNLLSRPTSPQLPALHSIPSIPITSHFTTAHCCSLPTFNSTPPLSLLWRRSRPLTPPTLCITSLCHPPSAALLQALLCTTTQTG